MQQEQFVFEVETCRSEVLNVDDAFRDVLDVFVLWFLCSSDDPWYRFI